MKYLLTLIVLLQVNTLQARCYIVDESAIIHASGFTPKGLLERCPQDTSNKPVTNFQDVSYLKSQTLACTDEQDCQAKLENLCNDFSNGGLVNHGRPIIAQDFSAVYCVKPVFSQSKRTSRVNAENALKASQAVTEQQRKTKFNAIKAQCNSATGLLKLMCEHITGG